MSETEYFSRIQLEHSPVGLVEQMQDAFVPYDPTDERTTGFKVQVSKKTSRDSNLLPTLGQL